MAAGLRKAYRQYTFPISVVVRKSRSSTGERGWSLLKTAVSGFPRRASLRSKESAVARRTATPIRLGDRRVSKRVIDSPDLDLLERRRQQPLNVAHQPPIRCRDE